MARLLGPTPTACPLTPDLRRGDHYRRLIWREPSGWVVAYGAPIFTVDGPAWTFQVINYGLPCWHAAVGVVRESRWLPARGRKGEPDYFPAGWTSTGLPACSPAEDGPCAGACQDVVDMLVARLAATIGGGR